MGRNIFVNGHRPELSGTFLESQVVRKERIGDKSGSGSELVLEPAGWKLGKIYSLNQYQTDPVTPVSTSMCLIQHSFGARLSKCQKIHLPKHGAHVLVQS